MTQRQLFSFAFGLLAAAAAVVFLAISIDRDVYAPGAAQIHVGVPAGEHARLHRVERALPALAQRNLNARRVLRKLYSVVAFAIVGFFAAPLVAKPHRIRGDAAVVAAFSTVIEVAQKVTGANEGLLSNAFDIGCGALGGVFGAIAFNALLRLRRTRGDAVR